MLLAMSPSLRAANVAIETWSSWFAEVGSESTDAGCASVLFSDASAAAVTCAIMKPELTPPSAHEERAASRDSVASISNAMRRSDSAPISAIGEREVVGGERDRLGVEVAAREHFAGIGEDQRIVGDRVRFDQQHVGRVAHLVEARAHHLRLAAQAVRVLHLVAVGVRRD